ncbi:MAG: M15 family metallopeptidase [Clostridiales bacterium]|nr:M15 family metallopeptidase [Clostridiales bacterium]
MFSDPYSERQEFAKFFSKNKVFIGLAALLAVIGAIELAMLFQMPGIGLRRTPAADEGAAMANGADIRQEEQVASALASKPEIRQAEADWRLMLVNWDKHVPEEYAVELAEVRSGYSVDARMLEPLKEMLDAAGAEGLSVIVVSAYRTIDKQRDLYENKVARLIGQGMDEEQAKKAAITEVAYPGNSEHHLGLAVDLASSRNQRLDETQADTEENQWLRAFCQEYGFILRYPADKSEFTGIIYEPWHFRYVGTAVAKEIMEKGICLEEYLDASSK